MGNTILQGSDWGNAAHWTGVEPVDNDVAIISGGLKDNVTAGLDNNGVDLDLLHIPPQYTGNVGSSGSPLICTADKIEHYGQGGLYFSSHDGGATDETDEIEIACSGENGRNAITELNSVSGSEGDINRVFIRRGTVRVLAATAWDATNGSVYIGKVSADNDCNVNIATTSNALPLLVQSSGQCKCGATLTTGRITGNAMFTQIDAAITTLDVGAGATAILNYGGTTTSTTIATTVTVHAGGILDLTQNNLIKTITTLVALPGSTVLWDDVGGTGGGLHTITNFFDYRRPRSD